MSQKLRAGLIGAGFIGPLHMEAVRRLGYVEIAALAETNMDLARRKADQLNIPKAYAGHEELLADPDIDVVHTCTPNFLHYPVVMDALKAGKHVICDKPLALTAREAREMRDAARAAGVVNAVVYNYRFNPMVQQARAMIAGGEVGDVRFVHGHYLQDWLFYETDFTWRLEADKGGDAGAIGDIGSHWCDTAQFMTGLKIERVFADLTTAIPVRKKPLAGREAFASGASDEQFEDFHVSSEDLGTVLLRFENGARGVFSVGQVCAGHKNDQRVEVNGSKASLGWVQEEPNKLWVGYRDRHNLAMTRDPGLLGEAARPYVNLPGGHPEGWSEAFKNLMSNFYSFIAGKKDPVKEADGINFPTFEDGYHSCCVIEAIIKSHREGGWVDVTCP
ncbi:MAG TPA: Gfo/Idh/MocA family oxidoreductase [Pyrinomonadaceae bacterium]|nr:Gfo/Idh/MocA family oxidoreductase [Pyrinomonadaceae bacterium]